MKAEMSKVDQQLLDLTNDFTIEDWNAIRTDEHWKKRDAIRSINAKNEFLLEEVLKYLRSRK